MRGILCETDHRLDARLDEGLGRTVHHTINALAREAFVVRQTLPAPRISKDGCLIAVFTSLTDQLVTGIRSTHADD